MDHPSVLYHATPYPEEIEVEGLRPHVMRTCAYEKYAAHPDPEIAAQASDHDGAFIFATHSPQLAMVYAFKISKDLNDFPRRMFRCGQVFTPYGAPVIMAVVGEAEAYREGLAGLNPTRFGIQRTEDFRPVILPDDCLTGEWVSRVPVATQHLTAERMSLDDLAGIVEFFDIAPSYRACPQDHLPGRATFDLLEKGVIRPANAVLGLPPVLAPMSRPLEGKTSLDYAPYA